MKDTMVQIDAALKGIPLSIPYSLHKHGGLRVSVRETDRLIDIHINPRLIRGDKQLAQVIGQCSESLAWGTGASPPKATNNHRVEVRCIRHIPRGQKRRGRGK